MKVTIGVDVGGTFTDVVLVDEAGAIHASKVVTTPADPRKCAPSATLSRTLMSASTFTC